MKKTLKIILSPFRWFFLGLGFIVYMIYFLVKNFLFYLGYILSNIFYFLYSILTFKHVRKSKINTSPILNPSEVAKSINEIDNSTVTNNKNINNNQKALKGKKVKEVNKPVDLNNKNNEIPYETELSVTKANFTAKAYDSENEGNLGYHIFVDNVPSKKNEDILSVPNKESKLIADAKTSKIGKTEEKVFKEIDEKQSFKDKMASVFPTLFAASDEKKKAKEEAKAARELQKEDNEQIEIENNTNKLGPKTVYEYYARNKEGKMEKNYYEAYSLVEVQSYLLSEGYDIYKIKTNTTINLFHRTAGSGKVMKTGDMVFFLTQLSTYLKAGITLTEAVEILSRQFKKLSYQKTFKNIANSLKSGDNFSEALAKSGNMFPRLLINMIKTSEMTGDLPETLDDMAEYYNQIDKTKKQMKSALTYPTLVLVMAIAVITFVLVYVIPKFTQIFASLDATSIPAITQFIIRSSEFLKKNYYWIMIGIIIFLLLIKYLYSNITGIRALIQRIGMKIPILKDVIIYNEVTTFTKTFSSLLKHGVYITDTMQILMQVTNNEIYRKMIARCIKHLKKGENISVAFKGHWAFPVPAYEMIVTGERTGKLAEMLEKVSEYYQDLHENIVARMKAIVEPVLIILLTGIVGIIILAVIVPMFSIYGSI